MQGAGGVGGLLEVVFYAAQTTNCFVAFDGDGNAAALLNAADGTSAAQYEYGPFGEVIRATGPVATANPFGFSTGYQDAESGILSYGPSRYDSSRGGWISRTAAPGGGGTPSQYTFLRSAPSLGGGVPVAGSSPADVAPQQQAQGVDLYVVKAGPPVPGLCGEVSWKILWGLKGWHKEGVIVQDMSIAWNITDCAGNPVQAKGAGAKWSNPDHYWEVWGPVPENSGGRDFEDNLWWISEGDDRKGDIAVSWTGSVAFYPGVIYSQLIAGGGWQQGNPTTAAGSLYSTTTNPNLTGGTATKSHKLSIKFDCCCTSKIGKTTVIVDQEPK
jgi:hypothetical protein